MTAQPPDPDLAARCAQLAAENARLTAFLAQAFALTFAAQNGNALPIAARIHAMARALRSVPACPIGCQADHPPARWAAMLGKQRNTIYRWMRSGLKYRETHDGAATRRWISHRDMSDFLEGFYR